MDLAWITYDPSWALLHRLFPEPFDHHEQLPQHQVEPRGEAAGEAPGADPPVTADQPTRISLAGCRALDAQCPLEGLPHYVGSDIL